MRFVLLLASLARDVTAYRHKSPPPQKKNVLPIMGQSWFCHFLIEKKIIHNKLYLFNPIRHRVFGVCVAIGGGAFFARSTLFLISLDVV